MSGAFLMPAALQHAHMVKKTIHDPRHIRSHGAHNTFLASFLYCEKGDRIYGSRNGCIRNGSVGNWFLWFFNVGIAEFTLIECDAFGIKKEADIFVFAQMEMAGIAGCRFFICRVRKTFRPLSGRRDCCGVESGCRRSIHERDR